MPNKTVTELLTEAEELLTRAESEGRDLDETETAAYDDLLKRAEKEKKLDRIRQAALDPRNVEHAVEPSIPTPRTRRDPYDGMDRAGSVRALDSDSGLRTRASDAVETFALSDRTREIVTRMVETDRSARAAAAVLALGNPRYERAFAAWLRDPASAALNLDAAELAAWRDVQSERAALGESSASALLPLQLDPAVMLINNGSAGIRDFASVKMTATNQYRAVVSPGITSEWKAEGVAASDATPTITASDISIYQGFASVMASVELLDDTDLAGQLGSMFADARRRAEDSSFVVGTGSGEPRGVAYAVSAVTASRVRATTTGSFSSASYLDVFAVRDALPARHRQSGRAVWLSNIGIATVLEQMTPAGSGSFWAAFGDGIPARLLGMPYVEATAMTSTITTGSDVLALVDFSQFYVVDRLGTAVEAHNVTDPASGRSTGQREFTARWRTGADLVNGNAGRVLRL